MKTATMTSKGQLTVPKSVRDALGLSTGDRVEFVPDGTGGFTLRPIREKRLIRHLRLQGG